MLKVTQKFNISITNNGPRYSMQMYNFSKKQVSNMNNNVTFMTWYKVSHLTKPIYNHKDIIFYLFQI